MGQIGKIIGGKFVPFADIGWGKIVLPANKAVVTDAQGNLSTGDVTAEEVGFLSGLQVNVQEKISELSDLNKFNITASVDWASSANVTIEKYGKIIQILIEVNEVALPASGKFLVKLPEEFIPSGYTYIPFFSQINSLGGYFYIDLSGNITLYANQGEGTTRWIVASWLYLKK